MTSPSPAKARGLPPETNMSDYKRGRPDDGSFYVENGKLHQAPRKSRDEDGTTRITLGFPVAVPTEWVDEGAMETIARVWNAHDDLVAALKAVMAEWQEGYGLKCANQCRAAIAKATGASA